MGIGIYNNQFFKFTKIAAILTLFIFILTTSIFWVVNTQPLSSYTSIEEQLFDSIAARNFANFGFWKTLFLPDYVSSRFEQDHPVVYTHMPPFEALIPGIFVQLNLGMLGARIFYVLINTLGLFYVYLFFSKLFRRLFAFWVVFFLANNFNNAFINADHFSHGLAGFFIFSLVFHFLCLGRNSSHRADCLHQVAIFCSILLASLTSYYVSIVQFTFSVCLYLFNFSKPPKRVFLIMGAAVILGTFLHLLQNILYLGGDVFLQDMILTMRNRIFGSPTTQEIVPFFTRNNIVCWGAASFSGESFINTLRFMLKNQFSFLFGHTGIGLLFCINLCLNAIILIRLNEISLLKKIAAMVGILCVSSLSFAFFFPALVQGYPMDLLFGTAQAVLMAALVFPAILEKKTKLSLVSLYIFVGFTILFAQRNMAEASFALRAERTNSSYNTFAKLKKYSNEVIWTNLTYSYVSYFVNNVVAGRCTMNSVKNRNLDFCDNVLINYSSPNREILKNPTIFVFSKSHLSGNMACGTEECLEGFMHYLSDNFELIEQIDDIYIFRIG